MPTRIMLFMVTAGSLLVLTGPASGQEVNSDVNIPTPRELVTSVGAINGLWQGTRSVFSSHQQFQDSLAQAAVGTLDERETRAELGDFMASLLVRAGIISFARPPARSADSGENSGVGSRPAWTGPTPMELSVSRTERSEAVRRR